MRIVFFGTSSFAIPCLEALSPSGHALSAVVTQPDKPGGRARPLIESPVKRWAVEKKVPLLQPADLSNISFLKRLKELNADLFAVVSYGKILPSALLSLPPRGSVNVHPSLLPRYRGASPIPWAILSGDRETGVSIIKVVETVDAGEVLLQKRMTIADTVDAMQLSERLSHLGGELLVESLRKIEEGKAVPIPQKGEVVEAPRFKKEDGLIDWTKSGDTLSRQIRALVPWPGSFSYLHGKRVLIWKAVVAQEEKKGRPGEIVRVSEEGEIGVKTGKGILWIQEIQLEGKQRMQSRQFLIGRPVKDGETFACNP